MNFPEIISTQMSADENQTLIGCIVHADKDVNIEANFSCLQDPNLNATYSGNLTFQVTRLTLLLQTVRLHNLRFLRILNLT